MRKPRLKGFLSGWAVSLLIWHLVARIKSCGHLSLQRESCDDCDMMFVGNQGVVTGGGGQRLDARRIRVNIIYWGSAIRIPTSTTVVQESGVYIT
jgi:hypothetical protein